MSGIYLSGKKQPRKQPEPPSRLMIIKSFTGIFNLRFSLLVHEIYTLHANDLRNSDFQDDFERLAAKIFYAVDEINNTKIKITKQTRSLVTAASDALRKTNWMLEKCGPNQSEIHVHQSHTFFSSLNALARLIDDFVFQFDTTCDLIWATKDLPFRPTDRELKKRFLDAVIHYCDENKTEKFPPYLWLLKYLKLRDNKLSPRTYGLWKKQMMDGVFHLTLQPRKIGNK